MGISHSCARKPFKDIFSPRTSGARGGICSPGCLGDLAAFEKVNDRAWAVGRLKYFLKFLLEEISYGFMKRK